MKTINQNPYISRKSFWLSQLYAILLAIVVILFKPWSVSYTLRVGGEKFWIQYGILFFVAIVILCISILLYGMYYPRIPELKPRVKAIFIYTTVYALWGLSFAVALWVGLGFMGYLLFFLM